MKGRKQLNHAIPAFLGAFTSRNCDHAGYWLLGLIFEHLPLTLDLHAGDDALSPILEIARARARTLFEAQLARRCLSLQEVSSAHLSLDRIGVEHSRTIAGWRRSGSVVRVRIEVGTRLGDTCHGHAELFVSAHDPQLERRSTRAT